MADQNNWDKPDPASNHATEVFETLRANIKAALAWLPGSRANPGTGAVRRSTPSAGEVLLETSNDATGSAWSTLFDSRNKVNKAGDTMTGPLTATESLFVSGAAATPRQVVLTTSGVPRWNLYADAAAESGGDAGSNFFLARYTDAGGLINNVFTANRATGGFTFNPPTTGTGLVATGRGGATTTFLSYLGRSIFSADGELYAVGAQYNLGGGAVYFGATDGTATPGFQISGAGGNPLLSGTSAGNITSAGNFRLRSAAPKIEHETGGQVVSELAYGTANSRGTVNLGTKDTAGANLRSIFSSDGFGSTAILNDKTGADNTFVSCATAQVDIGVGGSTKVRCNATEFFPISDNAMTCGKSGQRWSAVWAVNGTIQTSDLTEKLAVAPIDADIATRFVLGLRPITYRWAIGGNKVEQVSDGFDEREYDAQEEYDEQHDEPLTEPVEVEAVEQRVEMRNGVAVQVSAVVKRVEQRPVGDHVPLVDEFGAPVMRQAGTRKRHVGRGKDRREIEEPVMEPATHFVPRTRAVTVKATRTVKRVEQVPRFKTVVHSVPGKRQHAGFGAQDVKALMNSLGLDFGLWVLGEGGKQSLRPDQLIPFLAAALGSALERIEKLEKRKP